MFPGPNAVIIRNEAGEPLGWDNPDDHEWSPEDDDDAERRYHSLSCDGCGHHPEDCECEES